jgi:hypothetical protein
MIRLFLALIVALIAAAPTAEARRTPRCDGNFQYVRGGWVSTPYCRADQIARVGREAGFHATAEALLRDHEKADELCRFLKSDFRVHPACEELYSIFQIDIGTGGVTLDF